MNWFNYYISAFKNYRNYNGVATQKEFNIFIFFMTILILGLSLGLPFLCLCLIIIFDLKSLEEFFNNACRIVIFILLLCNFLPFIALIKRRINYVFPKMSNKIFLILIILCVSLVIGVCSLNLLSISVIWRIITFVLNPILFIGILCFMIFLMIYNKGATIKEDIVKIKNQINLKLKQLSEISLEKKAEIIAGIIIGLMLIFLIVFFKYIVALVILFVCCFLYWVISH